MYDVGSYHALTNGYNTSHPPPATTHPSSKFENGECEGQSKQIGRTNIAIELNYRLATILQQFNTTGYMHSVDHVSTFSIRTVYAYMYCTVLYCI